MSKFRDRYKKQKQDLMKRHEESVANKDDTQFVSVIDKSKIPEGIGIWKCPAGTTKHIIDYIPFYAGNSMPKLFENDPDKAIKEGESIWNIDFYTHSHVGVLENPYICPAKTNGLPCPICEYLQENRGTYSKEEYSKRKAKRQTLQLIWCHDTNEEEAKGLQIWQIAYFFMENNLKGIAERGKGGGTVPYFDPDIGKSVAFTSQIADSGWKFLHHRFEDRTEPIPDEILDKSFALDSILKYTSYEEIYTAFYGSSPEVHETTSYEVNSESEYTEEPEEEVEYDEPVEVGPDECPAGGEFGVDHEELEQCDGCVNWDNCFAAKQEMSEPEPEEEPAPPVRRPSLRSQPTKTTPPVKNQASVRRPIRKG